MPKSQEQYAADFVHLVNDKFVVSDPSLYLDKIAIPREYESSHQNLDLRATTALSLCPTENLKVRATRPKPAEETFARPENLHDYDVFCVAVRERYLNKSEIQTDFYVKTNRILMRRMVTFPDEYNFLPGESNDECFYRESAQLVNHIWHLIAQPGEEPDEKTHGSILTIDETEELLQWIRDTDIA